MNDLTELILYLAATGSVVNDHARSPNTNPNLTPLVIHTSRPVLYARVQPGKPCGLNGHR